MMMLWEQAALCLSVAVLIVAVAGITASAREDYRAAARARSLATSETTTTPKEAGDGDEVE